MYVGLSACVCMYVCMHFVCVCVCARASSPLDTYTRVDAYRWICICAFRKIELYAGGLQAPRPRLKGQKMLW